MNDKSRKKLQEIIENLLRLQGEIQDVNQDVNEEVGYFRDTEQESYDNLPENMQNGDRAQAFQDAADALDRATSALDDVNTSFYEAVAAIEEAIGG